MVTTATRIEETTAQEAAAAIAEAENILAGARSQSASATATATPAGHFDLSRSNIEIVDDLAWA